MENKMKKLIALFAVSAVASTSAVAAIALSGTASVSYDDNGSSASETTYDTDLLVTGTAGATTVTVGLDVDGSGADSASGNNTSQKPSITSSTMATTIGPVTVTADMFNETSIGSDTGTASANAREGTAAEDTGVTISLDAPIGDATVGVDNSGNVTISGTWSGITMSHTSKSAGDTTTASGAIAGMDVSVTNKAGATTWSLGTTVSGVGLTLASSQKVTATFGLAGNTMVVTSVPARASAAAVAGVTGGIRGTQEVSAKASYATVAISRALTSGATLAATYNTFDDSLTLKASVAF
jgi:hypothetical protein